MTHKTLRLIAGGFLSAGFAVSAHATETDFHAGTVIENYGQVASVETTMPIPKWAKFKVLFDTAKGAEPGSVNRTLESAARFLNMHAEAGVAETDMKVAVVFHGKGSFDLTKADFYGAKFDGAENATAGLIEALSEKGVRVILCGQSAAYHGVANDDLLPGVEMALSAMTAHALLQQQGYTLNPF